MKKIAIPALMSAFIVGNVVAQDVQSLEDENIYSLSLEELMNIPIVSASKEAESTFEAPVTSYVVTRQDIMNSGSTSIPEALRLAPGIIVREMANGTYDVSIRGGKDNLPSHQYNNLNTSILAMVNNRPIFNYLTGGTPWQNFPVDIADIERIEIVYGPNSPLYGPNAVDGVVNIITRRGQAGEDTYGTASVMAGESYNVSALAGAKISEKVEMNVSANHSSRKRDEVEYYDAPTRTFINDLTQHSDPNIAADPYLYYPNPEVGLRKTGVNFNLYYSPKSNINFTLNSAHNENIAMIGTALDQTLTQMSNTGLSHLFKAEVGNLTFQTSVLNGHHGESGNMSEMGYNYFTWDNYMDYNIKVTDNLSFRPALSFQKATIDDKEFTVDVNKVGLFNNKASLENYAFSLKADYNPIEALRIIGAVRADKFNAPDDTYIGYQGIASYKVNSKNILRLLVGRSFAGSFITSTYINMSISDPIMNLSVLGNDNLDLLQNNIIELGYKTQLGQKLSFDLSFFQQTYTNFSAQVSDVVRAPVFMPTFEPGEIHAKVQNISLESVQKGATLAATVLLGKVTFKPFVTLQQTDLTNYGPYFNETNPVLYPVYNVENVQDQESEFAPKVFGGFSMNMPVNKWNFNISGYYYDKYKLTGLNSLDRETGAIVPEAIEDIESKFLLNAKAGYNFSRQVQAFVNARNILGQDARESYGTDKIGTMLFAGFNINL